MSTVQEIKPNILCLEYRQESGDEDYGSCLWARFIFNLDRYELSITSDCGNYGYKWCETPEAESFLELMARIGSDYLLRKIYGSADVFNYEETKKQAYEWYAEDEEDKAKLDEIFEEIEWKGYPDSASEFLRAFDDENDGYFIDTWELPEYEYPPNALKIVSVFEEYIQPYIEQKLAEIEK